MLPIDRTALVAAQTNQVPNALIRSAQNIAALKVPYDTIDELNNKVDSNYGTGAIGTTQLADLSVTTIKLADANVTTAKLADSSVTIGKMADSSVGTTEIVDLAVTNAKIASGVITADKFVAGVLTNETANGLQIVALRAETVTGVINLVKKFGADPTGATESTAALQSALALGGDIVFEPGTYLIKNTGNVCPLIFSQSNTRLIGMGFVKIVFDSTTKGVYSPDSMAAFNLSNLSLINIYFQGHLTQGALPTNTRLWGMEFQGCTNVNIIDCTFSTFEGHLLNGVRDYSNQSWVQAGDKNSTASVNALLATNTKNMIVERCKFLNAATTCCVFFGVTNGKVLNCTFDTTGSLFPFACWTDDASQNTPLLKYSPNTNIEFIGNTVDAAGSIRMYGTAKGIISNNICNDVTYKSYDFDQQTNNFGGTETTPFFWMNYTERGILIVDNVCNTVQTKTGGYVAIVNNVIMSNANSITLALIGNNSILWPTAISYYDGDTTTANQNIRQVVANNTFIARHTGIVGISNLTSFTALNLWSENNRFVVDGAGVFTTYDANLDSTRSYSYSYPGTGNAINKVDNFATTFREATITSLKSPVAGISLGDSGNVLKVFDTIDAAATKSIFWFVSADDLIYVYLRVLMAGTIASEYDITMSRSANTVTPSKRSGGGTDTLTFAISAATGSRKSLAITNTGASRIAVECLAMSPTNLNQLYKKST